MRNCFKWMNSKQSLTVKFNLYHLLYLATFFIHSVSIAQTDTSIADTVLMKKLEKQARKSYGSSSDSSLYYAQRILDRCSISDNAKFHAFALNWIGICLMRKGYPDSAENFYQQTIDYALKNNQNKYAQMARLNRSINYHQQGLFEQSAIASQESLDAFQKAKDTLGMAHAQYNLGNCLFRLKRPNEALTFYQTALTIYLTKGSALNKANVYNAIGTVYDEKKKYYDAISKFKKSVDVKTEVGGANFCASEYINIGNAYRSLNSIDSAIHYYQKAYKTALLLGDQAKAANAYLDLSNVYNFLKKPDSAIYYAKHSMDISNNIEDKFLIYSNQLQLSISYEQKKEYSNAYYHLDQYLKLRDSIQNIEIEERVSTLEKKFKLTKKDRQILTKEIELSKKQSAIERQIVIIISLVLSIIVITYWYLNKRKKHQLQHYIEMNSERSRIAMDLHDHLGAELTIINSKLDTSAYKSKSESEKETLTKISSQVRNAGKTLRETVWSIQKEVTTIKELIERVESFSDQLLGKSETKLISNTNSPNHVLTSQQALDLFRIIQEAINNAYKYAKASQINLNIEKDQNQLFCMIKDNGLGFDISQKTNGFGLHNMRQRIKNLKGNFTLDSSIGKGTSISIIINLNQSNP